MAGQRTRTVIDGDGHLDEDYVGIAKFFPASFSYGRTTGLFPPLHHFGARAMRIRGREGRGPVGPIEWLAFLDAVGIDTTILYPTFGLAYGKITSIDWVIAVTRAYNDWVHQTYMTKSRRFRGMGIIPMQDPDAAVEELRRIVKDLGMSGAMIPTRGLSELLGAKKYWPVYEEANRLRCALATHGAVHDGMGFDQMNRFTPVHAIGHPISALTAFASIIFNGVFDKFPDVRWAFLEGGVGWFVTAMERFDRSHTSFDEYDPDGMYGPHGAESPSQYVVRQIKDGRLFVGCEGTEPAIPFVAKHYGCVPCMYSSDFPHEVTVESCKEEIEEVLENENLTEAERAKILSENAKQFYKL